MPDTDIRPRGVMVQKLPNSYNDGMGYAIATGPDGQVYVICTEGVGWKVKNNEWDGHSVDKLFADAKAENVEIDLADWVRVFGARLESNFNLWHRTLNGYDN